MHFYSWEKNNVLKINRFGMLEPALLSNYIMPEVMLVPLLAYDKNNNRSWESHRRASEEFAGGSGHVYWAMETVYALQN